MKKLFQLKIAIFIAILMSPTSLMAQEAVPQEFTKPKSFVEKYLPWLKPPQQKKQTVDPTETMQAPFTETVGDTSAEFLEIYNRAAAINSNNTKELSIPHRSQREVEEWITEAVGKSLNFKASEMKFFKSKVESYYGETGLASFKKFLIELKAIEIMHAYDKKLVSYVEDTPSLNKSGLHKGIYTWVYDVPVLVSYIDNDPRKAKNEESKNQNMQIRLIIARTPITHTHPDGIKIIQWSGKKIKKEVIEQ